MFIRSFGSDFVIDSQFSGFNVFLGVIPSSSGVSGRGGHGASRDDSSRDDSSDGEGSNEISEHQGGQEDQSSGGDHSFEGGVGGDLDTGGMVGFDSSISDSRVSSELSLDFSDHLHGGLADGFHTESREPVREHGSDQESGKNKGVNDIDTSDGVGQVGVTGSGEESSIKGDGDQTGGSDSESFSDGGGGVSSGVKGIGSSSGIFSHVTHFSDSSGVVRDRSVAINGESEGKVGKHTEGGEGNSEDSE